MRPIYLIGVALFMWGVILFAALNLAHATGGV